MSTEHCPECDAPAEACGCARGFKPLRVRPYVALPNPTTPPHPARPDTTTPPGPSDGATRPGTASTAPPHTGRTGTAAAQRGRAGTPSHPDPAGTAARPGPADTGASLPPGAQTPAYGIPVASLSEETMQLRPVPAYELDAMAGAYGSYGSHEARAVGAHGTEGGDGAYSSAPPRRRIRVLPIAAASLAVIGAAVLALTAFSGSDAPETALLDAKPSSPVISLTQVAPSRSAESAAPTPSPSRSSSPSRSASPSPSPSPSPTPSRSATRSASPSPTPSRSAAPSTRPPAQGPTLQYGDSGPEVEKLQRLLAAQGIYHGKFDGRYGSRTESAVSTFQAYNDIDEDPWGVYGPATRRALEG
ncbi:peptidoglycan-binding domain-containing protein [Streptomyces sp. H34-S4]|uniref:peptidoglycan-binding domain-containing protein n=1 Tax=Streptomyces sp. H34-S4 TaxID=2996463 RepID=UPI00226E3A93|nr:peptidoglycan-binding protein [Streptomyces sp. H34-S4]MCY0935260.1 peptidoglycan-binding protein [Streptomyces sp. H34-S4]